MPGHYPDFEPVGILTLENQIQRPGPVPMPMVAPPARTGAPQIPPLRQNFLDKLLGINDPNSAVKFDPDGEAAKRIRAKALTQAGLAIMAGNQRTLGPGPTLLQLLGQGLQAAQGSVQQQTQEELGRRQRDQFADLAGKPGQLHAMFNLALSQGNLKAAGYLAELIKTQAAQKADDTTTVPDNARLVRKSTGEVLLDSADKDEAELGPVKTIVGANGEEIFARLDEKNNRWVPTDGAGKPVSNPKELEQRAGFFVPIAEDAISQIDAFEGNPDRVEQYLSGRGLNEIVGPEQQVLTAAGRALGDAYLRLTSGAAIKEEEVDMFVKTYLPQAGDTERVRRFKKQQRDNMMRGLRVVAARALPGQRITTGTAPGRGLSQEDIIEIGRNAGGAGSDALSRLRAVLE